MCLAGKLQNIPLCRSLRRTQGNLCVNGHIFDISVPQSQCSVESNKTTAVVMMMMVVPVAPDVSQKGK